MRHSEVALQPPQTMRAGTESDSSATNGQGTRALQITLLPLHRLLVISLILTYAVLFVAILRWTISVVFEYGGYGYFPIERADLFLWTWGLALLPAVYLPIQVRKPSQFLGLDFDACRLYSWNPDTSICIGVRNRIRTVPDRFVRMYVDIVWCWIVASCAASGSALVFTDVRHRTTGVFRADHGLDHIPGRSSNIHPVIRRSLCATGCIR